MISVDIPETQQAKAKNANNKNMFPARYSGWVGIQIKVDGFFSFSVKNKTKYLQLVCYMSVHFHTQNKNEFKANK